MTKRLVIIVFAAVMMLGIFGLAGCDNISLANYKVTAKLLIDDFVATKVQSDYSAEKWAELNNVATDGKQAIEDATSKVVVDKAVNNAKIAIDGVKKKNELADFVLAITISKTAFNKDDEIKVNISLLNQSGKDEEISYYFLITPDIPTATSYPNPGEMPEYPYTRTFLDGETINQTNDLGGYFAPGQHEIKYKATFYLNWGEPNESVITLSSNTIKITIL